jgi:hypothetical protein
MKGTTIIEPRWELGTAKSDGDTCLICRSPRGKRYKIEFEVETNLINEPTNPKNYQTIIRAVKEMEKTGVNFYEFSIVGILTPKQPSGHEIIFPNLLSSIPLVWDCPNLKIGEWESRGRMGVEINCHIKPMSN